jgi:Fe(3+) dicitrate transport protein
MNCKILQHPNIGNAISGRIAPLWGAILPILLACCFHQAAAAQAPAGRLRGVVRDASGGLIAGAELALESRATGAERRTRTGLSGEFEFVDLGAGDYWLRAAAPGFVESRRLVRLEQGAERQEEIVLAPAGLTEQVTVYGNRLADSGAAFEEIPGSLSVLETATLKAAHCLTTDEALRKLPGVFARGEEGFALRPNIAIRGLNPTRSSKVLLLEDGIPLAYAPYGDNASYYHPPIERFESIEVVKGAGQVLYGPSTVGGVINYLTPAIPERPAGEVEFTGGNRDYLNGLLRYGGTWGRTGLIAHLTRKQGEGARENTRLGLSDFYLKGTTAFSSRRMLTWRLNYYSERSNVTYSGLTEEEFRANPRQNPFRNDYFYGDRFGASVSYSEALKPNLAMTANLYGSYFHRDWWRQSSNSAQRPNRLGEPGCASMADLHTSCGNEGRLRRYYTWGVEPRFRSQQRLGPLAGEADFGVRGHFEDQDRRQKNGPLPYSRDGRLVEDNKRRTQAFSGFWQYRLAWGRWGLTPGVRLEHVRYQRLNRLNGASGRAELTQLVPGIGLSFSPSRLTVFAGVHRGFAPPRAEDIITNLGGTVDLDPELSWNYELGLRLRAAPRLALEATAFRMDYENQIIPASAAGGIGATLTSAGRTEHEGFEAAGRWQLPPWLGPRHTFSVRTAYTWLPVARFAGTRYSSVPGFSQVSVRGRRLPYAPHHLANVALMYAHARGASALVEAVATSRQFGDDLNTIAPTPNGQRGLIPGNVLWNATVNHPLETVRATLFVTVKNLADRLVIVDRTRGILPSHPRLVQFGLRWQF